ncbi:hypothetical protein DVH24_027454 [Malus domestica]|uniref:RNase H type-1 domain-containing protein n=1 Tax=Malus domestica TaxID=3750 RepID=A0A498HAN1_MALDO|nr:hypothetical protein DVH24_027454 [Malus domestica]
MGIPLLKEPAIQSLSIYDWGLKLASSLDHLSFDLCLMVWWAIWGVQNNMLWNGIDRLNIIVARAIRFLEACLRELIHPCISNFFVLDHTPTWYSGTSAIHKGYHDIIIESDALQIVPALCNGLLNGSLMGNIVEDSKALLSTITGATAAHTRRQNNEAAHRIARYALSSLTNYSWFAVALGTFRAFGFPFILNLLSMN